MGKGETGRHTASMTSALLRGLFHGRKGISVKVIAPSPHILRINQELSKLPRKSPTIEEARRQVREHLREAAEEMSRQGRQDAKD